MPFGRKLFDNITKARTILQNAEFPWQPSVSAHITHMTINSPFQLVRNPSQRCLLKHNKAR